MPSVKMRRSMRVFVPKTKDGEGVRVLRSGRRLRVESGAARIRVSVQGSDAEDLFRLIDDCDEAALASGWQSKLGKKRVLDAAVVTGDYGKVEPENPCLDRRFGIVFSRKRKRFDPNEKKSDYDKKFGLQFSRRKRRRMEIRYLSAAESSSGFAGVLSTVLRYMWTAKVGTVELAQSEVVSSVFASCSLHFLRYCPYNKRSGFCKIYGDMEYIPLFDVNFASVPICFYRLHERMWFRSMILSSMIYTNSTDLHDADDSDLDLDPDPDAIYVISKRQVCQSSFLGNVCSKVDDERAFSTRVSRSASLVTPNRNGIATRSCNRNGVITRACSRYGITTRSCNRSGIVTRGCHKRRKRSLRTRSARNPALFGVHRESESSELHFDIKRSAVKFTSKLQIDDSHKFTQTNSSTDDIKLLKSSLHALGNDISTVSCSANLLVVESDRCFRESGACVTLELSSSNEWLLVVRKERFLRFCHRAAKGSEVKPNSTNRYTHAIIWCVESGWKLEFTERKDWAIFKELFKACGDRSAPQCFTKAIPIPKICEVSVCQISDDAPYSRPESYIKMNDDELSRALLKGTVSYDMDSGDEEWLNTANSRLEDAKIDAPVQITEDSFEMMIDAFEKAIFYSQDDFTDDLPPANLYLDLDRREVVETVYKYWTRKRKQKGVPLLRVFQLNEPKTPFVVKPSLRRKRSIKMRHNAKSAPSGRGKQLRILQAMAAKRNGIEEKSGMLEVEEAREAVKCALEVAIMKRRRAQTLMESADLAMYRASIAVRIAEATQVAEPNQVGSHFLD
ncbi:hypothetical protein V2J09_019151 [Rumex salicifolius]